MVDLVIDVIRQSLTLSSPAELGEERRRRG